MKDPQKIEKYKDSEIREILYSSPNYSFLYSFIPINAKTNSFSAETFDKY